MIELFSANTPNGKKISIMLEEIGYEYKVTKIDLDKGDQFKSDFKKISPFSKIPVIIDHKKNLDGLNIVIVGDLDHSRVTSSFVEGVSNFDLGSLTFCGHPEMCTKYQNPKIGKYESHLELALENADVVMALRIQYERFEKELNLDLETYKSEYQLSSEKLESAKGDAIVMHPGPVNYVEITEAVYDSENSVIRQQVANGVAIRMAVLSRFLGS